MNQRLNIITNTGFSGCPSIRLNKGAKRRPVLVVRPTLKKVNSRLKGVRRALRSLRGALRRTTSLDARRQMELKQEILRVERVGEGVLRYVDTLTTPRGEMALVKTP